MLMERPPPLLIAPESSLQQRKGDMKQGFVTFVGAAALGLALAGCAQETDTADVGETTAAADSAATMAQADTAATPAGDEAGAAQFLAEAMRADNSEVAAGNLAAEKGASQGVKDYGRMLAKDHGAHKQKVATMGQALGVEASEDTTPEAKQLMAKLQGLSGAEFDRAFAQGMVESHRKAIALYEAQEKAGGPEQVSALVRETLPVLRKHLEQAEALAKAK